METTGGVQWMAYLARTGLVVFAMLFATTLLTEHIADGRALGGVRSAAVDLPQLREITVARLARPELLAVAGAESAPAAVASPAEPAAAEVAEAAPQPVPVAAPAPAAPAAPAAPPAPAGLQNSAIVVASWYGPGFYGNKTACGQTYTPEILGVAHLTLPCGTRLVLTYGSRSITVTVIDRGPYVAGRAIDLSNATRLALGCTDLCTLRMQIGP
ncbi:MAG TPA: septal ring lytic transglycosylase RlpA family protein [Candidatus Limnocylindria bacterium]